jgi:hypothetical protein
MGKPTIEGSVDVTKLNKAWFFAKQNGGKMADIACFPKESEYSDGFIVQKPSREAREAGATNIIVGNWKWVEKPAQPKRQYDLPPNQVRQQARPAPKPPVDPDLDAPEDEGGVPF